MLQIKNKTENIWEYKSDNKDVKNPYAVTRVKEEISVNIDSIDPWNLKFLSESTETCGGMEAVHYSCDISLLSQMVLSRQTICFALIFNFKK